MQSCLCAARLVVRCPSDWCVTVLYSCQLLSTAVFARHFCECQRTCQHFLQGSARGLSGKESGFSHSACSAHIICLRAEGTLLPL